MKIRRKENKIERLKLKKHLYKLIQADVWVFFKLKKVGNYSIIDMLKEGKYGSITKYNERK